VIDEVFDCRYHERRCGAGWRVKLYAI
jgi:hypothetical protein